MLMPRRRLIWIISVFNGVLNIGVCTSREVFNTYFRDETSKISIHLHASYTKSDVSLLHVMFHRVLLEAYATKSGKWLIS